MMTALPSRVAVRVTRRVEAERSLPGKASRLIDPTGSNTVDSKVTRITGKWVDFLKQLPLVGGDYAQAFLSA
jgi:hypothetical protein